MRLSEQQLRSVIAGVLSEAKGPDVFETSKEFTKACRLVQKLSQLLATQLFELSEKFEDVDEIGNMELIVPGVDETRKDLHIMTDSVDDLGLDVELIERLNDVVQNAKKLMGAYAKEQAKGADVAGKKRPLTLRHRPPHSSRPHRR